MKCKARYAGALGAAVLTLNLASSVDAADGDNWQFMSTPFLWGTGIDGDLTISPRIVDINLGFDDIFDVTEYGFQTYLELRKQKFGFYAVPSYIKLSDDADTDAGRASFEQDFWLVEGGGFYNLVQTRSEKPFTLDVLAGVRYWNIDTDFELDGVAGVQRDFGVTFEVIDPVIGARMRQYITEKLSFNLRADIGGFGISEGDTSDLSWQAVALLGYDINQRFTAFGGYRALGIDAVENDGGTERNMDVVFHGALLGVQIRW